MPRFIYLCSKRTLASEIMWNVLKRLNWIRNITCSQGMIYWQASCLFAALRQALDKNCSSCQFFPYMHMMFQVLTNNCLSSFHTILQLCQCSSGAAQLFLLKKFYNQTAFVSFVYLNWRRPTLLIFVSIYQNYKN